MEDIFESLHSIRYIDLLPQAAVSSLIVAMPTAQLLQDVRVHTSRLAKQAACDIPRSTVLLDGIHAHSLEDVLDAMDERVPPEAWPDVLALCTQGAIGAVTVILQQRMWPLVISELPVQQHRRRSMYVDIVTSGDEISVFIRKCLRVVTVGHCVHHAFYLDIDIDAHIGSTTIVRLRSRY